MTFSVNYTHHILSLSIGDTAFLIVDMLFQAFDVPKIHPALTTKPTISILLQMQKLTAKWKSLGYSQVSLSLCQFYFPYEVGNDLFSRL